MFMSFYSINIIFKLLINIIKGQIPRPFVLIQNALTDIRSKARIPVKASDGP